MSFSQENYEALLEELSRLGEPAYKAFNEALIPGTKTAYGVRVPAVRNLARTIVAQDAPDFLAQTMPKSFEETMLRGFVIASMKTELPHRLKLTKEFLPLIDNWAVCDTFCGSFKFKASELLTVWNFLIPLFTHEKEFFVRFALVLFLGHFILPDFIDRGLNCLESVVHTGYYAQMAAAWAVSVCYVKFPEKTWNLLEKKTLDSFVQNKAIQKIRESRRVPAEDKQRLLLLKRSVST